MSSIQDDLVRLQCTFAGFTDSLDRYSYLVSLASLMPETEVLRQERFRYAGCQSSVWLCVSEEEGQCRLAADSDTLILRGVLSLLAALLDGRPVQEVLSADFNLLEALELTDLFSSSRVTGISGLLGEIQKRLYELTRKGGTDDEHPQSKRR